MKNYVLLLLSILCLMTSCGDNDSHVLEADIVIQDLSDIDAINLKGITEINGDVTLSNTSFANLDFLSGIEAIYGSLTISKNNVLVSLAGLQNLQRVKSLQLLENRFLNDVTFIENITIEDDLILVGNGIQKLPDLEKHSFRSLMIDEPFLEDYSFARSVTEIQKVFSILNSRFLEDLDDFSNLTSVGSELYIINNVKLRDFCGLKECILNSDFDEYDIIRNAQNPTLKEIEDNCE